MGGLLTVPPSTIAGHLDPHTLLHMSRVSKTFRALLMSKSSRAIWINSRNSVELPDLTAEDLSEPAYASLVYDRHCHASTSL